MKIKPGTKFPAVKCKKCNTVIPFQDNLENLTDEFRAVCPNKNCHYDGLYRKTEIRYALAHRKH